MSDARTRIILNPAAGNAANREVIDEWAQARAHVELVETKRAGDASELARAAIGDGVSTVVVAGGDGTVNEVVNGLAVDFGACRLGLLPLGTGNDFCRAANIPPDVEDALAILDAGRTQPIDVVRVNGDEPRYLLNAASGGFSELVHRYLNVRYKRIFGPLAYFYAGLKSFRHLKWHRVRIQIDDEALYVKTYAIIVANGQYVAGGHRVDPAASITDGHLDITVVTAKTFLQRADVTVRFIFGGHLRSHHLLFNRARRVTIEARPTMTFVVDGELGVDTSVGFEVIPGALTLISPPAFQESDEPPP